ncbi:hypothetical protein UFOVP1290_476 [uncultured Caudovirales phage]|uniref:Uncharacterized protein n=1 Tax=uncultured Caudovirales phage TaxID=2100421 RepID=A0A6J5RRV7_9CAUD|nr:hypothetical protein UFOVP1290_476 [uncultured Caudovirales phage]
MNIQQRKRCFRIITAYIQQEKPNDYTIGEIDIFPILKSNHYIMMIPNSYKVEHPTIYSSENPWGEEITFSYKAIYKLKSTTQIANIIGDVERKISSKFSNLIQTITTDYDDVNNIYTVTIIQKP